MRCCFYRAIHSGGAANGWFGGNLQQLRFNENAAWPTAQDQENSDARTNGLAIGGRIHPRYRDTVRISSRQPFCFRLGCRRSRRRGRRSGGRSRGRSRGSGRSSGWRCGCRRRSGRRGRRGLREAQRRAPRAREQLEAPADRRAHPVAAPAAPGRPAPARGLPVAPAARTADRAAAATITATRFPPSSPVLFSAGSPRRSRPPSQPARFLPRLAACPARR
jgi:hypothetical protein